MANMLHWLRRLLGKEEVALTLVHQGKRRQITVRELALGNKLAGDALLAVLAEKGLVDPAEVRAKIRDYGHLGHAPSHPSGVGGSEAASGKGDRSGQGGDAGKQTGPPPADASPDLHLVESDSPPPDDPERTP
jgi:hypothetical protein